MTYDKVRTRHNCTKDNKFELVYLGGTQGDVGSYLDKIKCSDCQREYIEIRHPIKIVGKATGFLEYDSDTKRGV